MFPRYQTQGFILKTEDRGEANQILTIFTKDFGKLEILAKAIRKIKSKLRGGTREFCLSEIEFIQGKTYKTLTDASLIENFNNLRKDLRRLKIAYQIAELLDNLIKGQEKDEKIWDLLNEIFEKLNNPQLPITSCQLLYYYFLWNFLSILGYKLQLYSCPICQKKLSPEKLYFSPKEGGVVDFNCFRKVKNGQKIETDVIKILRIFLKKDWLTLSKLKIETLNKKLLKSISQNYLLYVFGETR